MKRLFLSFAAALCALAVHAQDPQKPEPQPQSEPQQQPEAPQRPEPEPAPNSRIMEQIFACIAEGLPQDWMKAWFVITATGRSADGSSRKLVARFFFATNVKDRKGKPFKPCGLEPVFEGVGALSDLLPEEQRRWTEATISITNDGNFEAKFDFTPRKPAAAKPAAKPTRKKPDPGGKT